MPSVDSIEIAGLTIPLHDATAVLADLRALYANFQSRSDAFKAAGNNPHLCHAGCSHCCKSGAVFAVTLVEAVEWALAVDALPKDQRARAHREADSLLDRQMHIFPTVPGTPDTPGRRDEAVFSARVSTLARTSPACPLLAGDLCTTYASRPMLCRAYGFPVDAYAVESGDETATGAIVFRSLCVLYEGMHLTNYIRAKDLKNEMATLSHRLAGGQDVGRFTSPEAILATLTRAQPSPQSPSRK